MRDIVWTIIAIWLLYKLSDLFRNRSSSSANTRSQVSEASDPTKTANHKKMKGPLDQEGDYVDFEELK